MSNRLVCKLEVHLSTCTMYHNGRRKKSYWLIYVWRFYDEHFQSYIRNCWGYFLEYISIKYIVDRNSVGLEKTPELFDFFRNLFDQLRHHVHVENNRLGHKIFWGYLMSESYMGRKAMQLYFQNVRINR